MTEFSKEASLSLEEVYKKASRSHRKIAKWLLDNPTAALELSLDELAEVTGSSRSTVIRFCKLLGIDGYRDLKKVLARPLSQVARSVDDEVVDLTLQLTEETVKETFLNLERDKLDYAVEICAKARYLLWFGSTESGALAQCGSHKCSLLRMNSRVFVDYESFRAQSTLVYSDDVLIAISWGGDGDHLRRPVLLARELGMAVIGITTDRFSWLAEMATVCLIAGNKYVSYQGHKITIRAGQEALMNTLIFKTAQSRGITWQAR